MDSFLSRANQYYSGVQVGANARVFEIANAACLLTNRRPSWCQHFLGSFFIRNGQGRINRARSTFACLQSCLSSRCKTSLCTKSRVYQTVVRSISLYGCETWSVWVADERILEVCRILRVRHRNCVSSVELWRRLCLKSIPALLVQIRLGWFGHAVRRPEGELIKDLILPTLPAEDVGSRS